MRGRYFSFLSLGVAAAALVVASTSFALLDIANVTLGIGIGSLVVSLLAGYRYRAHVPSLVTAAAASVLGTWTIVSSQIFSLATVQDLALAEGLGFAVLALIGLIAHELNTERVVHSVSIEANRTREPHEIAA